MMSFGWKRKIASPVEMGTASVFQKESEKETIPVPELLSLPKKSHMSNEADKDRANILKEAGSRAAEAGQYTEALEQWDLALRIAPEDATLHEMKAQVLLLTDRIFPAITEATRAVDMKPQWHVAHQTLGRCQLAFGDVHMAIKSFCRALHQRPDDSELRQEDLLYAVSLRLKLAESQSHIEQSMNANFVPTVHLFNR